MTTGQPGEPRCEVTDLLISQCGHCRPPQMTLDDFIARLAPRPLPPPPPQPSRPSRVFEAQYESRCDYCDFEIYPGDEIRMADGRAIHAECCDQDD